MAWSGSVVKDESMHCTRPVAKGESVQFEVEVWKTFCNSANARNECTLLMICCAGDQMNHAVSD